MLLKGYVDLNDLYQFPALLSKAALSSNQHSPNTFPTNVSVSTVHNIIRNNILVATWHCRLGHPSLGCNEVDFPAMQFSKY